MLDSDHWLVEFWGREWNFVDMVTFTTFAFLHFLSLLAPFYFTWAAFSLAIALYFITGVAVTLSFHRNLSHRSFKLPRWLEYFFAYCGVLSLQRSPLDWVSVHRSHHQFTDTVKDPHSPVRGFWFSHIGWTLDYHGRNGNGVRTVLFLHATFGINSICHTWGQQVWETGDLSRNNWLIGLLAHGEGWHNNHHAFQHSARHGLEWWQIDVTWYVIRFLELVGLATDVKLPTETQKKQRALSNKMIHQGKQQQQLETNEVPKWQALKD
uniref:palmitoyl-monogalactosyldiacylglycerol delta-7 desaturase, chloroplastic-like isoform X2 n=1 Tax=Fragaria vesca subsp. vesca TaxID=101020 RepID=UPI0005C9AF96|nr:PREDICTED: palmitoyl-monogalactosyldiacylglycerol delta-7 desaturase, chloroplastic-like isoform X2 [Fragaria vesca subsp. vesca]